MLSNRERQGTANCFAGSGAAAQPFLFVCRGSAVWLYRTGERNKEPIVLYDHQPSRNGNYATAFLKDFNGYAHSDGYAGYNKLTGITRCGCRTHLRRKFVGALPSKKAEGAPPSATEIGRNYRNRLFEIEESLKNLSAESRYLCSVRNWRNRFLRLLGAGLKSCNRCAKQSGDLCIKAETLYGELSS